MSHEARPRNEVVYQELHSGPAMVEATYVLFVPKTKRLQVREVLNADAAESVTWREHRKLFGSEFYVSGPAALAREAHTRAVRWLSREEAAQR